MAASCRRVWDLETGDLDRRQQTRDDERARHQVLLLVGIQVGESANDDWRRGDTGQHRQGMLESEQEAQHDRDLVVEPKERLDFFGALHKWQTWGEQISIIIISK
ncbi:hypothetical protein KL929_002569 [Ogataea haglerorum]|nr:hypothetical protein KL929_002569 [Ogataea haglerorum]